MTDKIQSLEDANEAVFEDEQALRIQPPAPGATRYYYLTDEKGWTYRKCGHKHGSAVSAETVRAAVRKAMKRNGLTGGGVRAVDKSKVGRYA